MSNSASPLNGVVPPPEHRWKPGQSGNPLGRRTAGAYVREWLNRLSEQALTEKELRAVARDKTAPWTKRAAAERILRTLEVADLADFQPVVEGAVTLPQLRETGVNTEAVKKIKPTEHGVELELHDRAGDDFDRIIGHTEMSVAEAEKNRRLEAGQATENVRTSVEVRVPGLTKRIIACVSGSSLKE